MIPVQMESGMALQKLLLVAPFLLGFLFVPSLRVPPLLAQSHVDTTVVSAQNTPLWGDEPTLRETLRIGSLHGPVEESFGSVVAVVPASDGTVLIADEMVPAVFRFSESGEFLESLGGPGEGPGEFRSITGLDVLPDGSFVLVDSRLSRISWLSSDWRELETRHMAGGIFSIHRIVQVGSDGAVFLYRPLISRGGEPGERPWAWLTYPKSEERVDTLIPPAKDPSDPHYTLQTTDGSRYPFTVETLNWMTPGGDLVWGRNDEYVLNIRKAPDSILQLRRSFERVPVQGDEWRQWMGISDRMPRQRARIPNWKPVFRSLWVDMEGRIWLERYVKAVEYSQDEERPGVRRTEYRWREPTTFDILRQDGTLLGSLTLPERTFLAYARGEEVWTVQLGEFEEPYLVRFLVQPSGSK